MFWYTEKGIKVKKNIYMWHIWFAWYPVVVKETDRTVYPVCKIKKWMWLCKVNRIAYGNWQGYVWCKWEYKEIE